MFNVKLKKKQLHVILAVTFGNILEWYEIYSYIFLAPILSRLFFNFKSSDTNLLSGFILFGLGFLARPFGGLLFGLWGDRFGRKSAFIGSIVVMTVPTFAIGFLQPYSQWGIYAPIALVLLRLLQSLPESGETPGTSCFLFENSDEGNKKFVTSWAGVGNQIGAIVGVVEVLLIDHILPEDFLLSWGWKISFWSGGIIGLLGLILRSTLDETPVFKKMKEYHQLNKKPIRDILQTHKKTIGIGAAFGFIDAASFYLIVTYLPNYLSKILDLGKSGNAIISLIILVLATILIPFFGIIGDKISYRKLMITSTIFLISLLPFLYCSIVLNIVFLTLLLTFLLVIPISCITAFIPTALASLFRAPIRFTGVGLSFNIADGWIGGFTPAIAIFLAQYTGNPASFCWFILMCAIVSLISYFKIKE